MPLDIQYPLFGGVVFTSWRLYLALLAVPNLITNFLLRRLPETPKFVLNGGNEQETLQILRSIYAVNNKKKKEEYPVSKLSIPTTHRSRNVSFTRSYIYILIRYDECARVPTVINRGNEYVI